MTLLECRAPVTTQRATCAGAQPDLVAETAYDLRSGKVARSRAVSRHGNAKRPAVATLPSPVIPRHHGAKLQAATMRGAFFPFSVLNSGLKRGRMAGDLDLGV